MRLLSPSSRLVLIVVVVAMLAIAVASAANQAPQATSGASQGGVGATPSSVAQVSSSSSGDAGSPAAAIPSASNAPTAPTAPPRGCTPTDQDKYVYNPDRLAVQAVCIHVTGVIAAVRKEADGDLHLLLALDPAFRHLLRPANQGEELGDLVIEPVCVRTVTQADAIEACKADPDPLAPPFPVVGERVWMEGRYVFDLDHGGWAELHPLYRWGDG